LGLFVSSYSEKTKVAKIDSIEAHDIEQTESSILHAPLSVSVT